MLDIQKAHDVFDAIDRAQADARKRAQQQQERR